MKEYEVTWPSGVRVMATDTGEIWKKMALMADYLSIEREVMAAKCSVRVREVTEWKDINILEEWTGSHE